ncbi:MAG: 2-succinyl-5-enolpyruvyl-6-hydroxy-3-cyclohexene-1-carboxylic-acid synthase [Solirubrobacterales bacterium]
MVDPTNANTALASAFTEELERSGVTRAVISPGSRSTPLAVALWRQPGIEVTVALDERSGSFFALGAAQATCSPVALLCTSGTAAANFHPAVAEADLSSVPLIVLTADRPPELRDIGAGQTIDQIKLYGSAVRWFTEVGNHDADDAGLLNMRSIACRATATAAGDPRSGPVHLNFPLREPLAPSPDPGAVTAESRLAVEGRGDRPLSEVLTSRPAASNETLDRIVAALDGSARTMIVAGRMRGTSHRLPLVRLARRLNAPVLAEPTSQLRYGPHDRTNLVDAYDRVAAGREAELAPEVVLRFGEMPTSKALRLWLGDLEDLCQIVIDPLSGWYEPTRTANLIVRAEPEEILHLLEDRVEPAGPDTSFLNNWQSAGHREGEALRSSVSPDRATAGEVHLALANSATGGELVYTASSMAIRDQEAWLDGSETDLDFLANRGANGIDGLVASGLGAGLATGRPTTIITGDLGFQHDVGSLALAASVPTPVRLVVLNNGGGAIFSKLAQKDHMGDEEFETLMTTPGGMDIRAAAALFGIDHRMVTDPAEIPPAGEGVSIVEVPVEP